jgi:FkbM family methyltransferase
MSYFTSYAQNNEDVLLWRTLGHIKNGFYIDVGANDPEDHSVTKAFYQRGWYGINIEPLPMHLEKLEQERERDINLGVAAGASDGELTLYDVPEIRGWASPDPDVAEQHRQEGYTIAELTVAVRRLDGICQQYVDRPIHFLKIDVEGFEAEVLRGMDFQRWRPWVVVVEATLPNSRVTNHESWESLITGQGYQFAWFDGLNRYYVADEQSALLAALQTPVNVFDNYVTVHLVRAWDKAEQHLSLQLQAEQAQREQQALFEQKIEQQSALFEQQSTQQAEQHHAVQVDLENQIAHWQNVNASQLAQLHASSAWASDLQQQLIAHQTSFSWRITRPLRWLVHQCRQHFIVNPLPLRVWRVVKRSLVWLARQEPVRRTLLPLIGRFPRLKALMQQQLAQIRQDPTPLPLSAKEAALPEALRELPVSARNVFADLTRRHR